MTAAVDGHRRHAGWVLAALTCVLLAGSLTSSAPAISAPGLVAAYGFSEGSGATTVDSSGTGNTGAVGNATWSTVGKFGNALSFNGTNARVTVNDAASLDVTTGMTLEAWVFPTAGGGFRDVVYKGSDDIYYLEGSSPAGPPAMGGTFSTSLLSGASSLPLNVWTHVAGTYDGQTMRLYMNGAQVGSRAQTGPIATSSGPLTIGGDALYGQYFAGRIDEVRIYNQALTASQIQADMATPIDGSSDTTPPTVSMTSPDPGSPASHVVPLSASASDNVAVQSVEFLADGTSLGSDITPPYTLDWDSTAVSNGPTRSPRSRETPRATRQPQRGSPSQHSTPCSLTKRWFPTSLLQRPSPSFPAAACS